MNACSGSTWTFTTAFWAIMKVALRKVRTNNNPSFLGIDTSFKASAWLFTCYAPGRGSEEFLPPVARRPGFKVPGCELGVAGRENRLVASAASRRACRPSTWPWPGPWKRDSSEELLKCSHQGERRE